MSQGRELDERTLDDGVDIRLALRESGLAGRIFQLSAHQDLQPDPIFGVYRVELTGKVVGTLSGTVAQVRGMIEAIGAGTKSR